MSFTIPEILEIAAQIERNGVTFYRRAAALAGDESRRRVLLELADMEERHKDLFVNAQADLDEQQRGGSIFDAEGEAMECIRAMANGHVFDPGMDAGEILTGEETEDEILATAIGLEKESIVYYVALKEVATDEATRTWIQDVIREEMDHIAQLNEQRAAAGRTGRE